MGLLILYTNCGLVAPKYFLFQFSKWSLSLVIKLFEGKYELFLLEDPFKNRHTLTCGRSELQYYLKGMDRYSQEFTCIYMY